jgi:hypothetical protein
MVDLTTQELTADAKNRGVRTLLTGLAIDVAVGVALVLAAYFASANSWGDLEWAILAFSLAKSVVQAVCSFILRKFLDPSKFPTPLPPADPGEPADHEADAGIGVIELILIILIILILAGLFGSLR